MTKVIREKYPELNVIQCFHDEVIKGKYDPNDYDVIMLWAWFNVISQRSMGITMILQACPPEKTILCVASEWAAGLLPMFSRILTKYKYFGGANQKVTEILREGLPWATIENLEHGIDTDKFRPAPFPEIFTVGWAGNQNAFNKRFSMAQQVCGELKLPMKIAGHKNTSMYVDSSDMPDWYHSISILLITSVTEVHPLVYYEAAASGRPSVSTIVGDIGWGRASVGLFLDVNSPIESFVESIRILKEHPHQLERLGVAARLQTVKNWEWSSLAPNYVKYIMKVKEDAV